MQKLAVSILVLMELCIKTGYNFTINNGDDVVSILVLMELCIKTYFEIDDRILEGGFQSLF